MNGHLDAEAMAWTDGEVDGSLSIAASVKRLQASDRALLQVLFSTVRLVLGVLPWGYRTTSLIRNRNPP